MGMQVKEITSMMSRSAITNLAQTAQNASSVSFESVWSNQTQQNSSAEFATDSRKNIRKDDEVDMRDSLQLKESRNPVVKESKVAEEPQKSDIREMTSEEWEEAMEVLGAAAVDMIQQIAEAFDMTVQEVQGLMADLGMEKFDVLQQSQLGELLLAVAGAEDVTSLLTDENLYTNYQSIMNQFHGLMEQTSDTLQMDAGALVQVVAETTENNVETEIIPIEVVVDANTSVEDGSENVKVETYTEQNSQNIDENMDENTVENTVEKTVENTSYSMTTEEQNGAQAQNQEQHQMNMRSQMKEQTEENKEITEDKEQTGNLVLQNLKESKFAPQLQQLTQTTSAWDTDTVDIMKQIMDYMKIQIKPDMSNVEMQLHPESLGTLQIHVASKGGNITAQFVTQNETVKAVLESQMIQLKESFAEQGVKVDSIEVTVQTHQFEQNLEQGRGRNQGEPGRKTRPRRIQLNGTLAMDELEVMEEEEQLAAQMMAASGSTVDYTA